MRATSMRRLVGGAAALLLIGATLLSTAGATLAGARILYVGSDSNFVLNPGTITFSPVSAGGAVSSGGISISTVYVYNGSGQSLTHVVVTFAQAQDSGVTFRDQVLGLNASNCTASGGVITCDFGALKTKASRSFVLIANAPATAGTYGVVGQVVFDESNNPNGGNPQINKLGGSLVVDAASCDKAASFLPPLVGDDLVPDTGSCGTDDQRSSLHIPANGSGQLISIDDSALNTDCSSAPGYSCFGHIVSATANGGNSFDTGTFLTWTITYSPSALGTINPKQVAFQHGSDTPLTQKKNTCGTTFNGKDCIVGFVVNPDGSVTFTIWTAKNSTIRGLH
jgi:hypothetical protein